MSSKRIIEQVKVQRVTVSTSITFDTVLAKLYHEIGGSEPVSVQRLIQGSEANFEKKITDAVGPSDFMLFQQFNHGAWLKLCTSTDRKIVQIILGNPLIAKTIIPHNVRAGLHIPPRMILIENEEKDGTQIVYDLPSSLVAAEYESAQSAAALALDKKFEALVDRISK
jgi:uncharacterized protein (DUF302 family)